MSITKRLHRCDRCDAAFLDPLQLRGHKATHSPLTRGEADE